MHVCVCVEVLSACMCVGGGVECSALRSCLYSMLDPITLVCGVHVGQQSLWHYESVECHLAGQHIPYKGNVGLYCSLRAQSKPPSPGLWMMAMATRNSNHATPKAKDAT